MKRIGIITIHSDLNYGAFLQAFALVHFLRLRGYDAKIIDYRKIPNHPRTYKFPKSIAFKIYNLPRLYRYRSFIKPYLSNVRYNSLDEIMNGFSENFEVLISGSDQIWNPECGGLDKINPAYYLAFASNKRYKKISYASSVGSYIFNKEEQSSLKKWLGEYEHLSTREIQGARQLESILEREVKVVLDPTLLLTKEQWEYKKSHVNVRGKYLLIYYIDDLEEVVSFASIIAKKKRLKVALISNMNHKPHGIDILIPHCGPAQFLCLFDNASYVVTNSFHGTAFSVNFNKSFISVIKRNSPQRAQTLLQNVGLPERLLTDISQVDSLSDNIDWTTVNAKLNVLREDSIRYLINAIEH